MIHKEGNCLLYLTSFRFESWATHYHNKIMCIISPY